MDFKNTVCLPKTAFSMKANLPQLEKKLACWWKEIDLYQKVSAHTQGRPRFVLHDGPPYANGHLHMGHALNKILKDITLKYQRLLGKDCPFVPGWDCHGLPIEWKVEENYKQKNIAKESIDPLQFRKDCRNFALEWVSIQKNESQSLGLLGDWDHPYLTIQKDAEALMVDQLHQIFMNGTLYKGEKPVQWSVVEQTALAEAEVEYKDKTSPSIYVTFPILANNLLQTEAHALIWTTTPWTLPANRGLAYKEAASYSLISCKNWPQNLLVATEAIPFLTQELALEDVQTLQTVSGSALSTLQADHPLKALGYAHTIPFVAGSHVITDHGTGLVHTAPSHGLEDFELGKEYDLEVTHYVQSDGTYAPHTPAFAGTHIFKVAPLILEALRHEKNLFFETTLIHSYPHSWRSKAPLIYRTTPQWFISMDRTHLRQKALSAIETVAWYPKHAQNRLRAMVQDRPDWCVSRQRLWGVPLAIFVNRKTGEPLKDPAVNQRIIDRFRVEGSDSWFTLPKDVFLGKDHAPEEYEKVQDILDVWFESGVSHAYVLENRFELGFPADLYLEGSDQHRGWFQSSLLTSLATKGKAPFKSVVTHGFIVDDKGHKMSKSLGNAVQLEDVLKNHGADILRLWVMTADYTEDLKISAAVLKRHEEFYRKIRNTLRYLLGNLEGFSSKETVDFEKLPPLEQWVLNRLHEVENLVQKHLNTYSYHHVFTTLYNFCTADLSSFFFDIRKDRLYCDRPDALAYRATRTVLSQIFDRLCLWLAPPLSYTCEEAWQTRYPGKSIFLQDLPPLPGIYKQPELAQDFERLKQVRQVVTGAIELERAAGTIKSSLESCVEIFTQDVELLNTLNRYEQDLSTLFITSSVKIIPQTMDGVFTLPDFPNIAVRAATSTYSKCERCWRFCPDVGVSDTFPTLCTRCAQVVS